MFYVAAILPMESSVVRKFEKLIGKFIWSFSGKLLRISMEDIKNRRLSGGMQLPCIARMSKALLVSQCVRAVRSLDSRTVKHLQFWLGDLLGSILLSSSQGTVGVDIPYHFEQLGLHLADAQIMIISMFGGDYILGSRT